MLKSLLLVSYERRVIWLQGEVLDSMPRRLGQILDCMNRDDTSPIIFYVSSYGGSLLAALKMMKLIDASPGPVAFVGFNIVRSAGFLLMQSGHGAYALRGTCFQFHRSRDTYDHVQLAGISFDQDAYFKKYIALAQDDALMLRHFLRRGKYRCIPKLFEREAAISARFAKKIGLLDNYYDLVDFKNDRRAIRKIRAKRSR